MTVPTRVSIAEPLGLGLPVNLDLRITNDKHRVEGFFSDHFQRVVGILEARALLGASAVVFEFTKVAKSDATAENLVRDLNYFMGRVRILLLGLWMVKDNAVDFELGFSEVPHRSDPSQVTSNYLSVATTTADGETPTVAFSRVELEEVADLTKRRGTRVISLEDGKTPSQLTRVERALYLLQGARAHADLGLKIGFYCMCIEALFATSAAGLSHKLAERVAYFTAKDRTDRLAKYNAMKDAYNIRSAVLHGDKISRKRRPDLPRHAVFCDEVIRDTLRLLFRDTTRHSVFNATDQLDAYMRDLTLGITAGPFDAV